MAFYFYLSTKIIMVFITKSYQDLFGVRSYINARPKPRTFMQTTMDCSPISSIIVQELRAKTVPSISDVSMASLPSNPSPSPKTLIFHL